MDEGKRKEELSLPPDYVSLAQLQERWLQKQEEKKLKQKQEEEEKRERDAWDWEDMNRNQKIEGGFVRDSGVFRNKGKGKEILIDGPGNGGENDKRRGVVEGGRISHFKSAAAVEEKGKELSAGDQCEGAEIAAGYSARAGVLIGESGAGVEEICNVSVVGNEVTEETADMKRTNSRGGFRGYGRNRGSRRVHLEKKVENERGHGKNWGGRGRERRRDGGYWERSNGLKEFRPVVSKDNKLDCELEKKAEDAVSVFCCEIRSLSVEDRSGIHGQNSKGSNEAVEEDIFKGEGSNGEKLTPEIEKKVDHEVLARESARIGEKRGAVKGYQRNENQWRDLDQESRQEKSGEDLNEIEKKVDQEVVLAGEITKIGEIREAVKGYQKNKKWRGFGQERRYAKPEEESARTGEKMWAWKGYQKNDNFGEERRYARSDTSDKVGVEIEQKVGDEAVAGERATRGGNRGGHGGFSWGRTNRCMVWMKKEEKLGG